MGFRSLTDQQLKELLQDHEYGWTVPELSVIYRVSIRTIYRVLAEYGVKPRNRRRRAPRKRRVPKPRVLKPCGTNAAYQRHRLNKEYPCSACLAAHAENVAAAKKKGKK